MIFRMKIITILLITFLGVGLSLTSAFAAEDIMNSDSAFYFVQKWGEEIRLFFTFSAQNKIEYLLRLSDRRVAEIQKAPANPARATERYQEHFQDMERLMGDAENPAALTLKIREYSIQQQEILAGVYAGADTQGQQEILEAQMQTANRVTNVVAAMEGEAAAQEYQTRIAQIQQVQIQTQQEQAPQAPQEGEPAQDPGQNQPQPLKSGQDLQEEQGLNPENPLQDINQSGQEEKGPLEPAPPITPAPTIPR